MSKKQKQKILIELLQKDVLLDRGAKAKLLQNMNVLPELLLDDLIEKISKHVDVTNQYLQAAIQDDPKLVDEMKAKVRVLEKDFNKLIDEEQSNTAEEQLEEKLKNM